MVNREREKDIREFDYTVTNYFERSLIDRLKEPTRRGADLHLVVNNSLWYGSVYRGSFDKNSPQWKIFSEEYSQRAKENPMISNPYTMLDSEWNPVSITSTPSVRSHLEFLAIELGSIALWLGGYNQRDEDYRIFAQYLKNQARFLMDGEFDEGMKALLKLPTDLPITWEVLPVEPYNDPNQDKASFEGLLAYHDRDATRAAEIQMAKFKQAAIDVYGQAPLDAKVVVAHPIIMSGFLGEDKRKIVGHNKARAEVAKEAGNHLIQIFPVLAEDKHNIMAPKLLDALGIKVGNYWDLIHYVQGHEYSHSYIYNDEDERWGRWLAVGRELWAADRAVVLSSTDQFTSQFHRGVVRGYLEFACDDVGNLLPRIKSGEMQGLTVEEIQKRTSEYGIGGAIILRQAIRHNVLGFGRYDTDKLIDLARERDRILYNIALGGNEEEVGRFLKDMIEEITIFPVPEIPKEGTPNDAPLTVVG